MIKAGNHTVSDKGFTVVTENIGGVPRQAVVAELPGGISDEAWPRSVPVQLRYWPRTAAPRRLTPAPSAWSPTG